MTARLPSLFRHLCDDAAVFPPGSLPLEEAVPAHLAHRAAVYSDFVGPLVLAGPALHELGPLLDGGPGLPELVITAPGGPGPLADALTVATALPVRVAGVEVAVPTGTSADAFFSELRPATDALAAHDVFVEIPRDGRREEVIAGCAAAGHRAKFRTGGVKPDLYPDETELAAALVAVTAAGVPFKATAGLHHAVRNTDPHTGFEQHGFLNVLLATEAAAHGASAGELGGVLAERDPAALAVRTGRLAARPERADDVRRRFLSFGTCSITEPLTELAALGLVPPALTAPGGPRTERRDTP